MTIISGGDAVKLQDEELARFRVEFARLRSENARLRRELNEHKRFLWSGPETVAAKDIEDFKERQSVWAYLARRAKELAASFRKSAGTLPKIESMTAMLRHSVSTAAEMNLYHNPEISDAEKDALWEAYAKQLRFVDAIGNLNELVKQRILEAVDTAPPRALSNEIEAAVLACYDELMEVRYQVFKKKRDGHKLQPIKVGRTVPLEDAKFSSWTMVEAHRAIAGGLSGRSPKAIEDMVTRGRKAILEVLKPRDVEKHSRADDKAIAFYFAYHHARSQLHRETGGALARVRRLLSRFKS